MPRPLISGLAGLLVAALVGWALVLLAPSRTTVQVVPTAQGAVGQVNGSELNLKLPDTAPLSTGQTGWYLATPSETQYYQPDDAAVELPREGPPGVWFAWARPQAHWEIPPAPGIAIGPPRSLHTDIAGTSVLIGDALPASGLTATLVNGRGPAGLLVGMDPTGNGYALIIQPEQRSLAWWQVTDGVPITQVNSLLYRPAVPATLANFTQELTLALTATLGLAVLALVLGLIWRAISSQLSAVSYQRSARGAEESSAQTEHATRNTHPVLRRLAVPLAFALAGTVAGVIVALGPLEGIPHVTDDIAYVWQGKIFAAGHVMVPPPPSWDPFDEPYVQISARGWFSRYPPGWPLLLAPGLLAGLPWLINPLAFGASLALIYATGRRLYGPVAGFWAALLGLLSPFALFLAGSYMSHATTLLAIMGALYAFVRLKTAGSGQQAVGSDAGLGVRAEIERRNTEHGTRNTEQAILSLLVGLGFGWAFISREPTALAIALPFVVWALLDMLGAGREWMRGRAEPGRGRRLLGRLAPYGGMVLGAVPPLVVLAVVNQIQMGSPFHVAQELVGPYNRIGFGPGFGTEPGGHTVAVGLYNALSYWRNLEAVLFGWPLPLTFAPLLLALAGTRWRDWREARWVLVSPAAFGALIAVYVAYFSALTIYGPRYWFEALPFLLLLSGRGIQVLGTWIADWGKPAPFPAPDGSRSALSPHALPAVLVGALILFNLTQTLPGQVQVYTGYNGIDASAVRRVEAAHLNSALVFVALNPYAPRRDYGKVFFANDPLLRGPVVYVRDLGADKNRELLTYFPTRTPYYLPLDGPPHPGIGP